MSQRGSSEQPRTFYFAVIAMVSPIALNILLPALPDIATGFDVGISQAQLSLTLYLFFLAIGQLIIGPMADRFGRRPILLIGMAVHFLGSLVALLSGSLAGLLLGRCLQALGGCTGLVLSRSVMLDLYPQHQAAGKIAYLTLAIAISQAVAPTLGGYLNLWVGWQAIFSFSLLLSATAVWVIWRFIPETSSQLGGHLSLAALPARYWQILNTPGFLPYAFSTTCIAAAFYFYIGAVPYLVRTELNGTSADYGNWFLIISVSFMLSSFIAARVSSKFGVTRMILAGHLFSLLGGLALVTLNAANEISYLAFFLPMAVIILGRGFSQPNSQTAAISKASQMAGTASGLLGFIQLISGTLITALTPWLMMFGMFWIFLAIALCPLLAFFAIFLEQLNRR